MQKLAFGHLSTDSLADLDRGMSRSASNNSVGSMASDDGMPAAEEHGLRMAAAARNMFYSWEENISTNTGCKSMLDLASLDKDGSPRETPLPDAANASYFQLFFATLDKFLSSNAQEGKEDVAALPRAC